MDNPTQMSARNESEPGAAIVAEARAMTRQDQHALLALAALFALMLAASWQRWTSPIIDHGREMNLPVRMLAGEQLYSDIQYLYGPFAPYFNAFLYRVFGIHLTTLHVSGMVCAALILAMIYWLSRQVMSVREAALATGLVLVVCALKSTANYLQPYAYAALYGLVFALGSLVCTVRYLQRRAPLWLGWAGVGAGLALICKIEFCASAVAAAGVAWALASLSARRWLWRSAALFGLPLVAIGGAIYGAILRRVSWQVLVRENYVLPIHLPPQLIYFNRRLSGLANWPHELGVMIAGIGMFLLWSGLSTLIGALASGHSRRQWPGSAKRAWIVTITGLSLMLLMIVIFKVRADASPLTAAPVVLCATIIVLGRRLWRPRKEDERVALQPSILLVIALFGLVSIARVFLNVTTSGTYTPFFLPALIIIYLYLLFQLAPAALMPAGQLRLNAQRSAMAFMAIAIVAIGINSAYRYRSRNTYEITARRAHFFTTEPIGRPLTAALQFVAERTSPQDYLLVLPQGSINFLAERPYPLKEDIVLPGFLEGEDEADAVRRLAARPVPVILISNIRTPEFHDRAFGVDYCQDLMRWINEHYHLTVRFDSVESRAAQLGDKEVFILAYERNP